MRCSIIYLHSWVICNKLNYIIKSKHGIVQKLCPKAQRATTILEAFTSIGLINVDQTNLLAGAITTQNKIHRDREKGLLELEHEHYQCKINEFKLICEAYCY